MAGDWMKIELELPDKPEVHAIAGNLNLDPDAVVGKLIRVWQWFNKHTVDGNAFGVTYSLLDRITGVTGFGEAMMFAGWLEQKDKVLSMPKFDRHTSASAKSRALSNNRVSKHRREECNGLTVTKALPEKRREEKNKTPLVYTQEFETFWKEYPNKKDKKAAFASWVKYNPNLETVIKALSWQKKTNAWLKDKGQFIPMPSTYLNNARWEDEPEGVNKPFVMEEFLKDING